jgi:hypothetical protein
MLNQADRENVGVFAASRDGMTERRRARVGAYVTFRSGAEELACHIIDISSKGARLRLADVSTLPKFFELHTPEGEAYLCEIIRRKSDYVGVEFLQSS